MKTGVELIAEERKSQIEKHGRTIEKDSMLNASQQLRMAALALIANDGEGDWNLFPQRWNDGDCYRMAHKPYKERLIIAGALIAAEIDRLLNQQLNPPLCEEILWEEILSKVQFCSTSISTKDMARGLTNLYSIKRK